MKQLLKVLTKDMKPPIQNGCEMYHLKKWYHCEDFDMSDKECAPGYYVIPVSELINYHKPWLNTKVVSARVKGRERIFSPPKQRYEYMILDEILTDDQIIQLCKEAEPELGYKLSEALYPINPLKLPKSTVTKADIELLRQWVSVGNSVLASVWNSVWDSMQAYMGSLFPNIENWKYISHEPGVYPYQSAIDLWHRGLVPIYDGKTWMLLSGEKAEIVWTEPCAGWLKEKRND